MTQPQTLTVRTFSDRAEGLAHFLLRAGGAPRLIAYGDAAGCPMDTALAALEWSGAVGILHDDDLIHAARLSNEVAAAVIERRAGTASQFLYLGPRLDAPPLHFPRALVGGWFAAGMAGSLFVGGDGDPSWRYIEVGLES